MAEQAARRVIEIPELAIMILKDLDCRTLTRLTRVSKWFKHIIDYDASLRRIMFLDPGPSTGAKLRIKSSSEYHRLDIPPIEDIEVECTPVQIHPALRPFGWSSLDSLNRRTLYFNGEVVTFASPLGLCGVGSWKTMFLCQPPCQVAGFRLAWYQGRGKVEEAEFVYVSRQEGVRFIDLLEAVKSGVTSHDTWISIPSLQRSGLAMHEISRASRAVSNHGPNSIMPRTNGQWFVELENRSRRSIMMSHESRIWLPQQYAPEAEVALVQNVQAEYKLSYPEYHTFIRLRAGCAPEVEDVLHRIGVHLRLVNNEASPDRPSHGHAS